MFTKVDNVLIGKALKTSGEIADVKKGDIVMLNHTGAITDKNDAEGMYLAVATADGVIERSNFIQKGSHARFVKAKYEAPEEATITIDFTKASTTSAAGEAASTIVAGYRYVLRIVYKDLYEAPGQFTHTYEIVASSDDQKELAAAFEKKINKHSNRRVNAVNAEGVLTLTAMPKDDNEGVMSINEYSVVSMVATVYYTIPGALLSNQPEVVPGLTITATEANPGKGYWKQVRDLERRALGYKGHVFTDAYPVIEPKRLVEEGAENNYIMIEFDNHYLSPDNQYIKSTPLRIQLFATDETTIESIATALKGLAEEVTA